jgi:hypothetical protein
LWNAMHKRYLVTSHSRESEWAGIRLLQPASTTLQRLAVAPGHWGSWRGPLAIVNYLVYAEVSNVTSKCNGVTRYRLCHVLRAIILGSDNVSNFDRACGDPAFLTISPVSLVQWTNRLLPATGGSGLCPGGATHTLELGSPNSAVSLQW